MEIEFVATSEGLRLYLSVFGLQIPPAIHDCGHSEVTIDFGEYSYPFLAQRLVGGQKLLIPVEVQNDIINALQNGQCVTITVDRYRTRIPPDQFLKLFQRMMDQCCTWWSSCPWEEDLDSEASLEPEAPIEENVNSQYSYNEEGSLNVPESPLATDFQDAYNPSITNYDQSPDDLIEKPAPFIESRWMPIETPSENDYHDSNRQQKNLIEDAATEYSEQPSSVEDRTNTIENNHWENELNQNLEY
jgi:hypothetical protein